MSEQSERDSAASIWWFAFGYFACYAPYSALTKALSEGLLPGTPHPVKGIELLPCTGLASLVGMFVFISVMGWWKFAGHRQVLGRSVPCPGIWTFFSGLATATIIPTTTLAYTISGVSIVFMMLLMRGGLLVIAPIVDLLSQRKVRWNSWVALILALAALFVGFAGRESKPGHAVIGAAPVFALVNVALYLFAYFVRLRFMSRLAKSNDSNARTRYFVEEQMTATPALVLFLFGFSLFGRSGQAVDMHAGFTTFFEHSWTIVLVAIAVGLFSQGTGIFGGLILLDKRENTFCVPVNRASSVLAGLVATFLLWEMAGQKAPPVSELIGAGFIIAAIIALSAPDLVARRRRAAA